MRTTTLKAENVTLGTGNVLAVWRTAADLSAAARTKILRVEISQSGSAALAMIRGEISTRDTAGTLTTTSTAPAAIKPLTGAASGLAGNTSVIGGTGRSGTNSSADSGGTYTQAVPFNFPNTAGYLFKPDPDEAPEVPAGVVCCVRLLATPGTTTGWTVLVILGESDG